MVVASAAKKESSDSGAKTLASAINATVEFSKGFTVAADNNMFFGGAQAITQKKLDSDSVAFKLGKVVGDAAAMISGGETLAAGAALDATGVGAVAGVPLNAASAGAIVYGGTVIVNGTRNLIGDTISLFSEGGSKGGGRSKNDLKPDPAAQGSDHSTFKTDPKTGKVTNYETYEPNPRNPNGVDKVKRYDGTGNTHFNKSTKEYVDTPMYMIKMFLVEYDQLIQMKYQDSKGR